MGEVELSTALSLDPAHAMVGVPETTPHPLSRSDLRDAFRALEADYPLERIKVTDPRIREIPAVARVGENSLAEALSEVIRAAETEADESNAAALEARDTLDDVRTELERIRNAPLDSELIHLLSLATDRVLPLAARLGWDGKGGCTLDEAGKLAGVTRERVRQVQARVAKRLVAIDYFPALDKAISHLNAGADHYDPDAATTLQLQGITRGPFKPAGVLTAAEMFNRTVAFEVGADGYSVAPPGGTESLFAVALRSLSDLNYVASIHEFMGRVAEKGSQVDEVGLRGWLSRTPDVVWLDEAREWFWWRRAEGRNRYVNVIRDVLVVSPTVTIDSMRDALIRHSRYRGLSVSLPRHVLVAFCLAAGFPVRGDRIGPLPAGTVHQLSPTERKLVDLVEGLGGLAYGVDLRKHAADAGLNRNTVQLYLSYSAVVERVDAGLYQVRGRDVDPAKVAALLARPRMSTPPTLNDSGWTPDGAVWLAYRVSENMMDTALIGIPSRVRAVLGERRFEVYAADGAAFGTLVVGERGNAWGLGPFIRRRGVEVGDTLVVTLDTELESAVVLVGGAELMTEYQEGEGSGPRQVLEKATRPRDDAL